MQTSNEIMSWFEWITVLSGLSLWAFKYIQICLEVKTLRVECKKIFHEACFVKCAINQSKDLILEDPRYFIEDISVFRYINIFSLIEFRNVLKEYIKECKKLIDKFDGHIPRKEVESFATICDSPFIHSKSQNEETNY